MENINKPISSIICFNGGSGGDILLTLCLTQFDVNFRYRFEDQGYLELKDQYFKEISKQIFYKNFLFDNIDYSKLRPIENTHYVLDFYKDISNKIFFIDYPDSMQHKILSRYIEKRFNNDWSKFINSAKQSLPKYAQNKLTTENCAKIFNIQWEKNLESWRNNSQMIAINLLDFSTSEKMQTVIEKIIGKSIESKQIFDKIYLPWQEKNKDFFLN